MTRTRTKREYATTAEVAALLGLSEVHVRELAKTGRIPAFRIGKLWRFDPAEIREYMKMKGRS